MAAIASTLAQQGKSAAKEEPPRRLHARSYHSRKCLEACDCVIDSGAVNGNALAVALIGKTNAYLNLKEDDKPLAAESDAVVATPNLPLPHIPRAAIHSQMDEHQNAIAHAYAALS